MIDISTFLSHITILLHLSIAIVAAMAQYNNAVFSVTSVATPDPYVTYGNSRFFLASVQSSQTAIQRIR